MTNRITVETDVHAPIEKVWETYTKPEHITRWSFASDDWHSPRAANDLKVGGKFNTRMESKDGTKGFDFEGEHTAVEEGKLISYIMSDSRKVDTTFEFDGDSTHVIVTFDPESENRPEFQKTGWQAILNNFKKYTEQ